MGELCGFLAGGCPQIPQLYFGREIADRRGGLPDSAIFFYRESRNVLVQNTAFSNLSPPFLALFDLFGAFFGISLTQFGATTSCFVLFGVFLGEHS